MEPAGRRLKPAQNLREVTPRVCATCRFMRIDQEGDISCERSGGLACMGHELTQYFYVCDGWAFNTKAAAFVPRTRGRKADT
jgi:hypothetical protein